MEALGAGLAHIRSESQCQLVWGNLAAEEACTVAERKPCVALPLTLPSLLCVPTHSPPPPPYFPRLTRTNSLEERAGTDKANCSPLGHSSITLAVASPGFTSSCMTISRHRLWEEADPVAGGQRLKALTKWPVRRNLTPSSEPPSSRPTTLWANRLCRLTWQITTEVNCEVFSVNGYFSAGSAFFLLLSLSTRAQLPKPLKSLKF